jgi:DNA-directed RNA polymerase specialized sigma24 family protein
MRATTKQRLARLQRESQLAEEKAVKTRGKLRAAVVVTYRRDNVPASEIAAVLGISRQRVYQLIGP